MTQEEADAIAEKIAALQSEIEELVGDLNEAGYFLIGNTAYNRYEGDK